MNLFKIFAAILLVLCVLPGFKAKHKLDETRMKNAASRERKTKSKNMERLLEKAKRLKQKKSAMKAKTKDETFRLKDNPPPKPRTQFAQRPKTIKLPQPHRRLQTKLEQKMARMSKERPINVQSILQEQTRIKRDQKKRYKKIASKLHPKKTMAKRQAQRYKTIKVEEEEEEEEEEEDYRNYRLEYRKRRHRNHLL